jgi:hypothetical protein
LIIRQPTSHSFISNPTAVTTNLRLFIGVLFSITFGYYSAHDITNKKATDKELRQFNVSK